MGLLIKLSVVSFLIVFLIVKIVHSRVLFLRLKMATYFSRGSRPFCPVTGQDHRTVSAYKCPGCGLSNPNLRPRSPPPPDAEVIDVGDDTPERARPPAQALLPSGPIPPRGSRKATYLPSIPGLLLGHAEEERDRANQREADRKTKTGFKAPSTHTIHFAIGLARHSADEGWTIWLDDHTWSISLADKELTDEGFLLELHQTLITLNSRSIVKPWLTPKKEGNWLLSTQNPKKGTSEITHWMVPVCFPRSSTKVSTSLRTWATRRYTRCGY